MTTLANILPAPRGIELIELDDPYRLARAAQHYGEYWDGVTRVREQLQAQYGDPFSRGSSRTVFDGGDVVYKVGALNATMNEVRAYDDPTTYDSLPVAQCRLAWAPLETRYHMLCVPILIMETVLPATEDDDVPAWAYRIDHTQVGRNRSGRWVVFDAGARPERYQPSAGLYLTHETPRAFAA